MNEVEARSIAFSAPLASFVGEVIVEPHPKRASSVVRPIDVRDLVALVVRTLRIELLLTIFVRH